MRILHVPYSFYPDAAGGTEVYVHSLATAQRGQGLEIAIAAPAPSPSRYDYDRLPVWRFPVSKNLSLAELYGDGDPVAAAAFGRVLDEYQPHVVHLHAFTSAISVLLVKEIKRRGLPVVFNYHTPTVSCSRGTLRLFGKETCDGKLDRLRCAACLLQKNGAPLAVASLIATLPPLAGRTLAKTGLQGGIWTALRMPELMAVRFHAFHELMALSDHIVALCNWTRELLLRNDVPDAKITLCRQGIIWTRNSFPALTPKPAPSAPLRVVFLGRMDQTKGPHLLVEALRATPELPLSLDLYGVRQGEAGQGYAASLINLIGDDSRIRLLPPVPSSEVITRLGGYDAVLIPSQCLETGPLVVLEAFAARTPVIGSNLGGIAELVTTEVDGLLVDPPSSIAAWSAALQRICENSDLLQSLRARIRPPRHTNEAADELMAVYQR